MSPVCERVSQHLSVLSLFDLRDGIRLVAGRLLPFLRDRRYRGLIAAKRGFAALLSNGNAVRRFDRRLNRVSVQRDPLFGVCQAFLRRRGSDCEVFDQVFTRGDYRHLVRMVGERMHPSAVRFVIDAGANIGLTALCFAKSFPDADVVALEPDEGNHEQLRRNVLANRLTRVTALKAALWDAEESVVCVRDFRDGRDWSVRVRTASVQVQPAVQGVTLKKVLTESGRDVIDLLKIDVEGAEDRIFSRTPGIRDILARVRFIALEVHDEVASREKIGGLLRECGFALEEIGELTVGCNAYLVPAVAVPEIPVPPPARQPSA